MKLIFLNRYFHPDHSATSQILSDLAFDQARRGREVHVVTSRQIYDDPARRLPSSERHEGVQVHRVWTTRFGRGNLLGRAFDYLTFYISAGFRLLALARRGDVVVAKTDPPLISVVAGWAARAKGAKLVNWLQDVFPEIAERLGLTIPGPLRSMARSLRTASLRRATENVVLGERMLASVNALAPEAHTVILENWADGQSIRPIDAGSNPLLHDWGLSGRFVVGYSGNMGRAHDFQVVLDAAEQLRNEDVVFLFVGSGPQRKFVEAEATRRSLGNLVFKPYQARDVLAASLSAANAHLVTLRPELEGLIVPSKFYGIAAAGRPVIFVGDPEGEVARLISREDCGVVVRAGDAAALASTIRSLRDRPDSADALGKRARAAFERHWDRAAALERWNTLLTAVN